jgi:hypothetical protein
MHRLAILVSAIHVAELYIMGIKTIRRVLQMQIMIVTLLEKYDFFLPPHDERTRVFRKPSHVMMPMAEGHRGAWMGLHVKRRQDEAEI